jgi:hypothetical protein
MNLTLKGAIKQGQSININVFYCLKLSMVFEVDCQMIYGTFVLHVRWISNFNHLVHVGSCIDAKFDGKSRISVRRNLQTTPMQLTQHKTENYSFLLPTKIDSDFSIFAMLLYEIFSWLFSSQKSEN